MLEWTEGLADWTQHRIHETQGTRPYVSESQPSLDISPIWTPVIAAEVRKLHANPSNVFADYVWKLFFMWAPYREFVSLPDLNNNNR
jgi:hypothetical protein